MMRPHFSILTGIGGSLLLDGSRATRVRFSTNTHGPEQLTAFFPMSPLQALAALDRPSVPHARLVWGGEALWSGRVENMRLAESGLEMDAFGYWRAFKDVPYTALWSDTDVTKWRAMTLDNYGSRTPEMYNIDTDNRLNISLKKDAVYGNVALIAELTYVIPSQSSRQIVGFDFSLSTRLPANWDFYVRRWDRNYTFLGAPLYTANIGTVTTSHNLTFSACDRISISINNNTGGNYTNTQEDYYWFCKLTNLRIKTTTGSVNAEAIAGDLLPLAPSVNQSNTMVVATGMDLLDELYEDQYPADILTRLAQLGDTSGRLLEVGVDAERVFYLRPQGHVAREWYVDADAVPAFERTLDEMFNSAYAIYQDANGDTLRTGIANNADSINNNGITRRMALDAGTSGLGQATYTRDTWLLARRSLVPRASLTVSKVLGASNTPMPPWVVRAGDYITVRNLPISNPSGVSTTARRFLIARTEMDMDNGTLTIEPEDPLPALDVKIAQSFPPPPGVI